VNAPGSVRGGRLLILGPSCSFRAISARKQLD
jgi:hypothetical protein